MLMKVIHFRLFEKSVLQGNSGYISPEECRRMVDGSFPTFHTLASVTYFANPCLKHHIREYVVFLRRKDPSNPLYHSMASIFENLDPK